MDNGEELEVLRYSKCYYKGEDKKKNQILFVVASQRTNDLHR